MAAPAAEQGQGEEEEGEGDAEDGYDKLGPGDLEVDLCRVGCASLVGEGCAGGAEAVCG